jgi:hypothetical protein
MSVKKRQPVYETAPKTDGGVAKYPAPTAKLDDFEFGTFVRMIKNSRADSIEQIAAVFAEAKDRASVKLKKAEPVAGMPEGSDQCDVSALVSWVGRVTRTDWPAKAQLARLVATLKARTA